MQEKVGVAMLGKIRMHRADDAQVIGTAGNVREEFTDVNPLCPWRLKRKGKPITRPPLPAAVN